MDIQRLLSEMSLAEKLGQLTQLNANFFKENEAEITGPASRLDLDPADAANAGSVLNFDGAATMRSVQEIAMARQPHHIPLLFMQDVVHGYRTIYPIPLAMGCSFDPDLMEECASMAAKEAASGGVNVTFAPMVDLVHDARWGRVMETAGGEDKTLGCRMAAAQVRGFQGDLKKGKIAACVKHFAAYGGAEAGRDYNAVELSEHTLREDYLPAYRAAVDAGARLLMTSFNTLGGEPVASNRHLITDILRGEWDFDGSVISDYNSYREMLKHGAAETEKEAVDWALSAGGEIEMMSALTYRFGKELLDEGKITPEQIDRAVLRVLRLKEELGLFDDPMRGATPEEEQRICLCAEHRAIACRAAEESAVLLKNDGVLPFSDKTKKVALIGPFAREHGIKGFWACHGRDEDSVTVEEGVRVLLPDAEITVCGGCSHALRETDISGVADAVRLAREAEVVVLCLGEFQNCSGEGNSRAILELSPAQLSLAAAVAAANPNTAVLLFCGRPLAISDLADTVPAILTMFQPGTEGGTAAARLLFGKTCPSGRLSMSFPYCTGQEPIYYAHQSTARPTPDPHEICEGGYVSRYLDAPTAPLYPFGFGLSYTEFSYGELKASGDTMTEKDSITFTVTVTNTGSLAGKETVQWYLRDEVACPVRPVKELVEFQKIELAPGESREVRFTVKEPLLRYHTRSGEFASETGRFTVTVGPDSERGQSCAFTLVK
ncbi:MAG: glycoside hydrolase family 3 C-terminal domain-containing protein [Ruminococcus sp.]|nr:glycoside hydrolase family 3 C-terminal domain-containing protein [Candidatus Apopatosoma intestinale]